MTRGVADTSIFIARDSGRPLDWTVLPEEIAVSVVTIGELRAALLVADDMETRERRLATLTRALRLHPIVVDDDVAESWAKLRVLLHDTNQRMPANDSWIAATAMSLRVPVVTRAEDYVAVDGLQVIVV